MTLVEEEGRFYSLEGPVETTAMGSFSGIDWAPLLNSTGKWGFVAEEQGQEVDGNHGEETSGGGRAGRSDQTSSGDGEEDVFQEVIRY